VHQVGDQTKVTIKKVLKREEMKEDRKGIRIQKRKICKK